MAGHNTNRNKTNEDGWDLSRPSSNCTLQQKMKTRFRRFKGRRSHKQGSRQDSKWMKNTLWIFTVLIHVFLAMVEKPLVGNFNKIIHIRRLKYRSRIKRKAKESWSNKQKTEKNSGDGILCFKNLSLSLKSVAIGLCEYSFPFLSSSPKSPISLDCVTSLSACLGRRRHTSQQPL